MFESQKQDMRGVKSLDVIKVDDKPMPARVTYDAKLHLIMEEIAKGTTYMGMVKKFCNDWNLGFKTVNNEIQDAIKIMRNQELKDTLVSVNMQRLDSIIEESMESKDRKNAIRGIDIQNKLCGGYEEKVKVEGDGDINFVFNIGE